jgi:hypothetical protein
MHHASLKTGVTPKGQQINLSGQAQTFNILQVIYTIYTLNVYVTLLIIIDKY